jgi:tetratricopeptide (TPR) repeat protein
LIHQTAPRRSPGGQATACIARQLLLLTAVLCLSATAVAETLANYYFESLDVPPPYTDVYAQVTNLVQNESYDDAILLGQQIIDSVELQEDEPLLHGKLTANLGITQGLGKQLDDAVATLQSSLDLMGPAARPFSTELVNVVMAQALIQMELGQLDEAETALRRAQNLTHRESGVYSIDQLPIVRQLFLIKYQQGDIVNADRQQYFTLHISEQTYGQDSEELLPILDEVANYFTNRASRIPFSSSGEIRQYRDQLFRNSRDLFERAIRIIEANYGANDIRLVRPLEGLARMRFLQRTNNRKSEEALERAVAVIESNPSADLPDRVDSVIRLADLYTMTSDSRASETYLKAWQMLQDNPEYEGLSIARFGTPTRLYPRITGTIYLSKTPDAAAPDEELFVNAEYTVRASGRVGDVKILERNVTNEHVRILRTRLSATRFRPRIVDGQLVDSPALTVRQVFKVAGRIVEPTPPENRN